MTFEVQHTDAASDARAGLITTDHGPIQTPIFMPVGTVGSVKGVHFSELRQQVQAQIILACVRGSTYYVRQAVSISSTPGIVQSLLTQAASRYSRSQASASFVKKAASSRVISTALATFSPPRMSWIPSVLLVPTS